MTDKKEASRKGGLAKVKKGFAYNLALASVAGAKGGRNGKRGPHKFKLKPGQMRQIEVRINGEHVDQYEAVGVIAIMLEALDYKGEYEPTLVKNKYNFDVFKFVKKEAKNE